MRAVDFGRQRDAQQGSRDRQRHRRAAFDGSVSGRSLLSTPIDMDSPGGAAAAQTYDPLSAGGRAGQTKHEKVVLAGGAQSVDGGPVSFSTAETGQAGPDVFPDQSLPSTGIVWPLTGHASLSGWIEFASFTGCTGVRATTTRGGETVGTAESEVGGPASSNWVRVPWDGEVLTVQAGDVTTITPLGVSGSQSVASVGVQAAVIGVPLASVAPGVAGVWTVMHETVETGTVPADVYTVTQFDLPSATPIDSYTGPPDTSPSSTGKPTLRGMAVSGSTAWVAMGDVDQNNGIVYTYTDGAQIASWSLLDVIGLAFDGTDLWVLTSGRGVDFEVWLRRVSTDGTVLSSTLVLDDTSLFTGGLAFDGTDLWTLRSEGVHLQAVRLSTSGTVLSEFFVIDEDDWSGVVFREGLLHIGSYSYTTLAWSVQTFTLAGALVDTYGAAWLQDSIRMLA